ncbi:hypothetical protein LAZ67_15001629 [Cordylochernes scorpioides]|uniref:Integrase catalytic domain-containing protein n=1 Tax=Cordylochernes scorpioides TaxID=51811 RepID=A0ABY6L8X6_9ARAC|nr:hypothetical protein LAZ67_15001629 [Cordylochernes scorpioides]
MPLNIRAHDGQDIERPEMDDDPMLFRRHRGVFQIVQRTFTPPSCTSTQKSAFSEPNESECLDTSSIVKVFIPIQKRLKLSPTSLEYVPIIVYLSKILLRKLLLYTKSPKKDNKFTWNSDQQDAFDSLKKALMSEPVLAYFEEQLPTELPTDASDYGIGAVLLQINDGKEGPVGYASSTLSKAEKNYSTTERECLATIWAVNKFRPYLFGREFVIPPGLLKAIPPATSPFQRVGMDLLGRFPKSNTGNKWIIVCTDYLTRFAVTKALPTGEAKEAAKFFNGRCCSQARSPQRNHHGPRTSIPIQVDCGTHQSMLVDTSVHDSNTAYYPQTNGLTERLNKTLANMIAMYVKGLGRNPALRHVRLQHRKQDTTGFTPFKLIHGREAETTVDTLFPNPHEDLQEEYNQKIASRVEDTRQLVRLETLKAQEKDKARYDSKHEAMDYNVGDLVGLLEKLMKRYLGPYRVTRKLSDVTFEVEPVDQPTRRRQTRDLVHVLRMKPYHDPEDQADLFKSQGFMVWAGIFLGGRTALHIFRQGTLTGQRYRDEILAAYVMPQALEMGENVLLMYDNARPHRAGVVNTFLQNHAIARMNWPARSPDLNPIEHVWDNLRRRISSLQPPPRNTHELETALTQEWALIPQELINFLIISMGHRCRACLSVKGDHTPY